VAESKVSVIRYGTVLEQAIYNSMRVLAVLDLLMVPFVGSFDYIYPLRGTSLVLAIDLALTVCFSVGVVTRLRTSFIRGDGMECKEPEDIFNSVTVSKSFLADLVALFTTPFLHVHGMWAWLCLLRLCKCWRIPRSFHRTMLLPFSGNYVRHMLAGAIGSTLVVEHLYGCAWFLAKMNSPRRFGREWSLWNGWSEDALDTSHLEQSQFSVMIEPGGLENLVMCYLRALRDGGFMLAGWGGVDTLSVPELLLLVAMAPLSGCLVAYVYGVFVSALGIALIQEERFVSQSAILSDACRDVHLPKELQSRIHRYHSYISMHHMGSEARDLWAQLSPNLITEVRVHRMGDILVTGQLFEGLPSRHKLQLVWMMNEQVFSPGEMVIRKADIADCLYIVLRGSVAILVDDDATHLVCTMYEGEIFGIAGFLQNEVSRRTAWVRAQTYLVVLRLDKVRLDAAMQNDPELKACVFTQVKNHAASNGFAARTDSKRDGSIPREGGDPEPPPTVGSTLPSSKVYSPCGSMVNEATPLMSERVDEDEPVPGSPKRFVNEPDVVLLPKRCETDSTDALPEVCRAVRDVISEMRAEFRAELADIRTTQQQILARLEEKGQ